VVHRNRLQRCIAKTTAAASDLNITANTPIVKRKRQVKTGEVNESVIREKLVMENEQEFSVSNKLLAITIGEEINKRRLTY
jgi:hypothetical protein